MPRRSIFTKRQRGALSSLPSDRTVHLAQNERRNRLTGYFAIFPNRPHRVGKMSMFAKCSYLAQVQHF